MELVIHLLVFLGILSLICIVFMVLFDLLTEYSKEKDLNLYLDNVEEYKETFPITEKVYVFENSSTGAIDIVTWCGGDNLWDGNSHTYILGIDHSWLASHGFVYIGEL